jgi:O-antigen ligase
LRDLAFLVETILFTGLMLSLVGLVMYFTDQNVVLAEGGTRRLLSVYGSPNALALMLGRCWPFALAYLLFPVSQWRKAWAGLAGSVMLIALALTQSVGGLLLGLPIGTVMILLAWRGRRAIPVLAGVGASGLLAILPLSIVLPRLRQLADLENSTTLIRLNLWRSTIQLLQEHPLTGVGLDQFLYAYRSRYILPEAWQDPNLSHPHNFLLDYWVRLGFLGVLLAGLLQWYFWRQAWGVYQQVRNVNPLKTALIAGAMGAMGAGLAHGLVDMAYFHINLSYLFVALLALAIHVDEAA